MIPKIIHFVWFGGAEQSELIKKCISSWHSFCPEYEYRFWNEDSFDVTINTYCLEAYKEKKWAFVSDYVRLWALVNYGGFYLDSDVELLRSLDEFLNNQAFLGFEGRKYVSTGIMACEPQHPFFKMLLHEYDGRSFIDKEGKCDLTTNVEKITQLLCRKGLALNGKMQTVENVLVYPTDFFCPKDPASRRMNLTSRSVAIHHYDGSWFTSEEQELLLVRESLPKFYRNLPESIGVAVALFVLAYRHRSVAPIRKALERYKSRK